MGSARSHSLQADLLSPQSHAAANTEATEGCFLFFPLLVETARSAGQQQAPLPGCSRCSAGTTAAQPEAVPQDALLQAWEEQAWEEQAHNKEGREISC